ncbi:hypothetical protein NADFUDRAFT_51613 [Nadsonia fulvescens var. elongata DSM 6958]|uniref:Uncharacterized protein n=1 Tax=Nadsonia fulvescens var. elongata DSM 6958 TaxID=857566 RepID=A0A1E3PII3_9ASCO|nr:hypothetical protein NADFUDRAFT_51613 [Nadsonia fulvescens var. elongata DSM 6958]
MLIGSSPKGREYSQKSDNNDSRMDESSISEDRSRETTSSSPITFYCSNIIVADAHKFQNPKTLLRLYQELDNEADAKISKNNTEVTIIEEEEAERYLGPPKFHHLPVESALQEFTKHLKIHDRIDHILLAEINRRKTFGTKSSFTIQETVHVQRKDFKLAYSEKNLHQLDNELLLNMHNHLYKYSTIKFPAATSLPSENGHYYSGNSMVQGNGYQNSSRNPSTLNSKLYWLFNDYQNDTHLVTRLYSILMDNQQVPDITTFHILISKLASLKYYSLSWFAFEALLSSKLEFNMATYKCLLLQCIYSFQAKDFFKLLQACNLDYQVPRPSAKIFTPDAKIDFSQLSDNYFSSVTAEKVVKSLSKATKRDLTATLRKKFTKNSGTNESATDSVNHPRLGFTEFDDPEILAIIMDGMRVFNKTYLVDCVLQNMVNNGIPMTWRILHINAKIAFDSKDSIKSWWVWKRAKEMLMDPKPLVIVGEHVQKKKIHDVLSTLHSLALKADDQKLRQEIISFLWKNPGKLDFSILNDPSHTRLRLFDLDRLSAVSRAVAGLDISRWSVAGKILRK